MFIKILQIDVLHYKYSADCNLVSSINKKRILLKLKFVKSGKFVRNIKVKDCHG